jgi:hypothetical protein
MQYQRAVLFRDGASPAEYGAGRKLTIDRGWLLITTLGRDMDAYLNARRDLLVVKKGCPIPPVAALGS